MDPAVGQADASTPSGPSPDGAANGVVPLFVDLDGTLIATDVFCESLIAVVKLPPRLMARVPLWAAQGRPALKKALAEHVTPNAEALPYHADVLEFLRRERERGRPI